jgi:chemotaxis protein CheD
MRNVRMGEIEVSRRPGDELIARGLGSCIGLALVDRVTGVAGLAHIVLPYSTGPDLECGKFADVAVPELIKRMRHAGATKFNLEAALAGGACMFRLGDLDIGARNEAAVRSILARCGVLLRAAETGGDRGRTLRVAVGDGTITVKEAGGEPITLLDGSVNGKRKQRVAAAAQRAHR